MICATRFGVDDRGLMIPRVDRNDQPWALLRNAVGILTNKEELLELPVFVEEAGGGYFAGVTGVGGSGDVDNGVVGEFGDLAGVVEVVVFAKGEAAVEDDVAVWVFGVGIDEDGRVSGAIEFSGAEDDFFFCEGDRQFGREPGEVRVAFGIAPEDEV